MTGPLRIREADMIRCPLCRLPWELHPLTEETGEYYCRNIEPVRRLPDLPLPPDHRRAVHPPSPADAIAPGRRITPPGGPFWTERGRWP